MSDGMGQKYGAGGLLGTWFPDRLNIAVALLLLPFWLVVALGFLSMFFSTHIGSHGPHRSGGSGTLGGHLRVPR